MYLVQKFYCAVFITKLRSPWTRRRLFIQMSTEGIAKNVDVISQKET